MAARATAVVVVLLAAGLFLAEGIRESRVPDTQIEAGDPADTLGLGIYPVLAILGIPAALSLMWLWRNTPVGQRTATTTLTLLLLAAAVFNVWAYSGLRARVFR